MQSLISSTQMLTPMQVIGCAVIMAIAAIEVIQTSCEDLKDGFSTGRASQSPK